MNRLPPSKDHVAHHIVAVLDKRAAKARKVLDKFKIDINDPGNGVWLPNKLGVGAGAYHPGLSRKKYYENVNRMLARAKSRKHALRILKRIADRLSKNKFPR